MPKTWIYKCNNRNLPHQGAFGDWSEIFKKWKIQEWGQLSWVPALKQLKEGDRIIAYQTDRNELVGVCEFVRFRNRGSRREVLLKPIEAIGVKVRPLKNADPRIDAIPALQPGPVQTLYEISEADAERLLKVAGAKSVRAAGLPDPEIERIHIEGEKRASFATVRSPTLRAEAKKRWGLECAHCGFEFERFYGKIGRNAGIVHHLKLFSGRKSKRRKSTVDDVRVVCANCHYVLHLEEKLLPVSKLNAMISKAWSKWSDEGIRRAR